MCFVIFAIAEPPVIVVASLNQTVQRGSSVTLNCVTEGSSLMTVMWVHDVVLIPAEFSVTTNVKDSVVGNSDISDV